MKEMSLRDAARALGLPFHTLYNHKHDIASARKVGTIWICKLDDVKEMILTVKPRRRRLPK